MKCISFTESYSKSFENYWSMCFLTAIPILISLFLWRIKKEGKSGHSSLEPKGHFQKQSPTLCSLLITWACYNIEGKPSRAGALNLWSRWSRKTLIICKILYMKMCIFLGKSPDFPSDSQKSLWPSKTLKATEIGHPLIH